MVDLETALPPPKRCTSVEKTIAITGCSVPAATLYAAESYLLDRNVMQCERIVFPAHQCPDGEVRLSLSEEPSIVKRPTARRKRLLRWIRRTRPVDLAGGIVFEMRKDWPENWAHFLRKQLPQLAVAATSFDLAHADITVVVPAEMPSHIVRILTLLGLSVVKTNGPVIGRVLAATVVPVESREAVQHQWAALPFLDAPLNEFARSDAADLPRLAFISRRGTRTLSNEAEVEAMLSERGFQKLYAEDLAPERQIGLFHHAECIVAIHGAALGPLLYRSPTSRLRHVVELMPCGHMFSSFRLTAWHVGCTWAGVRGRIKPNYINGLYDQKQRFHAYSLDDFEIDPKSLDLALSAAQGSDRSDSPRHRRRRVPEGSMSYAAHAPSTGATGTAPG